MGKSKMVIIDSKKCIDCDSCRNCEDAPCLDACPAGAIVRRKEDGYILLLEDKCVGCNMCVMVCPFNAIEWKGDTNYKCDTSDSLKKYVRVCDRGVIKFKDIDKDLRKKRRGYAGRLAGKAGGNEKW